MKKLFYFFAAVILFVSLSFVGPTVRYAAQARDSGGDSSESESGDTQVSKTPEVSEAPEASERSEVSESPEASETPGESVQHQQEKANENIKEATQKLAELANLISKQNKSQPLPQNVQVLFDQATEKLDAAKQAFGSGDFGQAAGQAKAAKSLAKNAERVLEKENEAMDIEDELSKEVEDESITELEVSSGTDKEERGLLKTKNANGEVSSRAVPFSTSPLVKIETPTSGSVGVSVASGSAVLIDNEGIEVQSDLPVVIDTVNKTLSVKTSSGTVIIKVLPFEAFGNLDKADKPTEFSSVKLENKDNKLQFNAKGVQNNKLLGFIPVKASIETVVDAQDGSVVSVQKPWFMSIFGFLFTR